jgi:tetraacyldisaccharide-1-P 4'-kinase
MLLENFPKPKNARGLIIVSDKKISGVKFADSKFKPDVIIVDDGFQLQRLFRDLDIVMELRERGSSAGNMREPLKYQRLMLRIQPQIQETINYFHKNYTNVVDLNMKLKVSSTSKRGNAPSLKALFILWNRRPCFV